MAWLRNVMGHYERLWFEAFADHNAVWTKGRQGTGYEICSIKHEAELKKIIEELSKLVRAETTGDHWDAYFIRYTNGTFVPKHKDEASIFGMRHKRLNIILQNPESGGEFYAQGVNVPKIIPEGDAYLFYPDEHEHEVTPVVGTRLILSIGAWI